MGTKTEEKLKMVDGQLKVISGSTLECDIATPLTARQAMRRRSLAMEMVGIASYEILETINEEMFGYLQEAPPSSYVPPTLERILRADLELWSLVGEHLPRGLTADSSGILPIDKVIQEILCARKSHSQSPTSSGGKPETLD